MSTGGRYRENAGVRRAAAVMYDSAAWIGLLSTNGTPPKLTEGKDVAATRSDDQPLSRSLVMLWPPELLLPDVWKDELGDEETSDVVPPAGW